ncbi:MAG: 30S ribosomal protein S20 [Parcubacteria group bacterium]|nr:30S ribosomal protein S20 [Parcubacteria group bacterium]
MPQLKNAEKALRQSVKRRVRNQAILSNIDYLVKNTKKEATAKSAKAEELLKASIKAIDKAVQKGTMKLNTASRKKSRLLALAKKLQGKK